MLRFLGMLTSGCFAGFLALNLLISQAWGWGQYDSDALYVVYFQMIDQRMRYFVVNTDGTTPGEALTWAGSPLEKVDCSPDGSVFGFLTERGDLYTVTASGTRQHAPADRAYATLNVANDGTTALFDPRGGWLLVNETVLDLTTADEPAHPLDRVDISPEGHVLLNRQFDTIEVIAPGTGEIVASVPRGFSGVWLAPSTVFMFYELETSIDGIARGGGQYVMDIGAQKAVRVGGWTMNRPLSPNGRLVAGALVPAGSSQMAQVIVYDLMSNAHYRQLTHERTIASQPVCFLNFRPDALIAG